MQCGTGIPASFGVSWNLFGILDELINARLQIATMAYDIVSASKEKIKLELALRRYLQQ
jgi:hypothetical protein